MRNLNLLFHRVSQLPASPVSAVSLDSITAHKFYGLTQETVFSVTGETSEESFPVQLADRTALHGFEYLALNDEFCLALNTTLAVFNPRVNVGECEEVAFFDTPVAACAWSPDQEIVAVVTSDLRCIVLNSVYDTLSDTSLVESGEEQFMNVGWGKKETQFHGSEGKHARQTVETGIPITEAISRDCHICWRGDGAYFVVLFSFEDRRLFKVFDKEGQLKFTSERCYGLDGPVAWRPSGLWIAVPQLLAEERYCIALFERNGLRHRELILPFSRSQEMVTALSWSVDSEVLMVVTKSAGEEGGQKVYLYTINNYHWYLKQTLRFDAAIDHVKWDPHPANGKVLHLFLATGEYHKFKWSFDVSTSLGHSSADEAMVAVIDGSDVLLTNFRSFIVPPPMSSYKLSLPAEEKVDAVGFVFDNGGGWDTNQLFVLTDGNKLRLYGCVLESHKGQVTKRIKDLKLKREMQLDLPSSITTTYHWNMINGDTLVYATQSAVHLISTREAAGATDKFECGERVVHNINIVDDSHILIGFNDGSVCTLEMDVQAIAFKPEGFVELFTLPLPCERHEVVTLNGQTKVYSLNPNEMLYQDGEQFQSDITSMCRIGVHLAVTTVDELKFVDLRESSAPLSERKIERGGLLVKIVPNDSRTVLQMPRGNLETIKPRTLSVAIVGRLLDECQYFRCYDILRKERINLNLIVDHDPDKFFSNIETFIDQVNNPNWLNLFLAELRNEDVTETMYQSQYSARAKDQSTTTTTGYKCTQKIDFICQRFCEVTEAKFSHVPALLLPKITSYVKRGDLETALQLIWTLKCSEGASHVDDSSEMCAEEALKYLLYLVNVDDLFDVALGMYDFDLVLFVARKSQKDPKEYLPFMNGLKQLEETYRKFQIDVHLKRYRKAVSSGIRCGAERFEECLEVIREQVLYGHAMDLLEAKDERYKAVASKCADHLREKGKLREAGFMYERSGDLEAALSCAQKTLQWERCIALKRRAGATEEEVFSLADTLLVALIDKGSHADAAQLCATVLRDSQRLLNILIDGFLFERAYYGCASEEDVGRVRESFERYHTQVMGTLEEDFAMFCKQKLRLVQVRKEKAEKLLNPDDNEYELDCDLYSDTTSMRSSQHTGGTRGTGKSFRSSKNRRKHERKLLNLKEGNAFEDIALIDALHTLVLKLYSQQEVIRETLQAAIALNMNALGRELQKYYKFVLEEVKNSLDGIWIPEMIVSEQIVLNDELDLAQLQKGQHFALIKPHQRFKPLLSVVEWEFEVFK